MRIGLFLGASSILGAGLIVAGCFGSTTPAKSTADSGLPGDDSSLPSGDASGTPAATLPTGTIDLGPVDCGAKPTPQTASLTNTGPVSVTWSATVDSIFAIEGAASGTVAPGATGSLAVGAAAVPTSSAPGTAITGTLTVTTNVPGFTTVKIPVTLTPQGGTLVLTPPLVGIGSAQIGTTAGPLAFVLQNVGNAPVSVTLGTPTDSEFGVAYTGAPSAAIIAAGGTLAGAGATFAPTTAGAKSATVAVQTTSALCGVSVSSIPLSGTGSTTAVGIGPNPLDFLAVECGTAAAAQGITIKNGYTFPITYTATLGKGAASPYALSALTGSVPASGQTVLQVTPNAIPVPADLTVGAYDDTLTIATSAPGDTGTAVALKESAQGAILALTMANTACGVVSNTTATLPFTITNTGNEDAAVGVGTTGTGFGASLTAGSAKAGGGTDPGTASFTATTNTSVSGTLSVITSTALCAAAPTPLALTATGAVPVLTPPSGSLAVSGTCNGGASTQVTLTLQNTGNAPLTLSGVASNAGHFTIVSVTTPIAAKSSGTIVIQGTAAAGSAGGAAQPDKLVFQTNEVGAPQYSVPVTNTVNGANLSFAGGTLLSITSCSTVPITIQNTGNLDAYVVPTGSYFSDGPIDFSGTFFNATSGQLVVQKVAAGGTFGDGASYGNVCNIPGACNLTATETYSTTNAAGSAVGICNPLPTLSVNLVLAACSGCC
jgi:hypothetical protein